MENADHAVCLVDHNGNVLARTRVAHSGEGLQQLLAWLSDHGVTPARAAVAIEVGRGAVVETLLERGFSVFTINPKQVDRFRDRYSVAGAKDDSRDAMVLGCCLRTDQHLFRAIASESPQIIRLRELSRTLNELRDEFQALTNRAGDLLRRYYPQMLTLSSNAQQPFLWDLLEQAPLPADAARLSAESVGAILKSCHMRRLTPVHVLDALRQPPLRVARGAAEAAAEHLLTLLPRLRVVRQMREQTLRRLRAVLKELRELRPNPETPSDVEIIASMPGYGEVTVATLLSEANSAITARDQGALRTVSGVAPVSRNSGKSEQVVMRRACNERLRNALHFSTLSSLRTDPINRRHYDELRAAEHSCGRSVRGVADRNLSVLMSMLRHGTLYDPTRRKGHRPEDALAGAADSPDSEELL